MTDRFSTHLATVPLVPESLQRITRFSRDLGRLTTLPAIAERVLSELLDLSHYPNGILYLTEHEHADFRKLAGHGSDQMHAAPATLSLRHPLIEQLVGAQQKQDESLYSLLTTESRAPLALSDGLCFSAAIPLVSKGRLIAIALLHMNPVSDSPSVEPIDLLATMAQIAANALDSMLVYEDLRQSQALMRRTDRLRSLETIAGGFAHEIRNPLTSIKTFIQLAPERKDDAEFIRDFSRIVLDDVYRIERLIQEILDYARYMEPKLTEEDVNDLVSSCLYFIDVKARSRGIRIEKELASELPRVMLDRQQMKQVLLNLFLNALDAIGERPGLLRVKTAAMMAPEGTAWIQMEVEDTGHGISAADLDHIFDPFFTTKHKSGENEGTGLGLAIAHQIIREHRGTIQVQSTVGSGTTFRVNIPSIA
ncbi:MAG TPA: ATP-binding protein [Nitrospira sp.]|nr:ATP-binding protein [Nitrospira sp.]